MAVLALHYPQNGCPRLRFLQNVCPSSTLSAKCLSLLYAIRKMAVLALRYPQNGCPCSALSAKWSLLLNAIRKMAALALIYPQNGCP